MIAPIAAQAQWSSCTNGICYSGNVGIGTSNPANTLDVGGSADVQGTLAVGNAITNRYAINQSGYEYSTPSLTYHSFGAGLGLDVPGNVELVISWANGSGGSYGYYLQARNVGNGAEPISLNPLGGNVGIGTTNPQYPLQVNGTIAASEVTVTTSLSDYVFDPNYRVRPLQEIADYVKQNHHLPDIPSDAEAKQKGVSLGEMQAKLLAKIEELTLHMIQAEQENRELRERIANLERAASAR